MHQWISLCHFLVWLGRCFSSWQENHFIITRPLSRNYKDLIILKILPIITKNTSDFFFIIQTKQFKTWNLRYFFAWKRTRKSYHWNKVHIPPKIRDHKNLPSDPRWSRRAPWQQTVSGLQGPGWRSPWWGRSGAGRRLHGWIPVSLWGSGWSGCHWKIGHRGWRVGWVKAMAWAGRHAEEERGKTEGEAGCFRQTLAAICDVVQAGEIPRRWTTSKKNAPEFIR